MAFYQVDLASMSTPAREAFRQLAHIDTDVGSDVIILAATEQELLDKARHIQLQAVIEDSDPSFSATMLPVDPDTVINGKTVRRYFEEMAANAT